jgi:hypothetical protein
VFSPAVRRGIGSALTTLGLLALALLPSRLAVAMRVRGGTFFERVTRALAGTTLDVSAVLEPLVVLLALLLLFAALVPRRRTLWQHLGAPLFVLPWCFVLYVLTVLQQEVKAERGAFSTMQEITAGAVQTSFVEGTLGFFRYERIWIPAVACGTIAFLLLLTRLRAARREGAQPWRGWAAGFAGVLALSLLLVPGAVLAQSKLSARLSRAALGDPLTSLIETTMDLIEHRVPLKPSELLMQLEVKPGEAEMGAARMGWPVSRGEGTPCFPHPHARLLEGEPAPAGAELLAAFERVSEALFDPADEKIALFQFSLESFRADDLHALNPFAPESLDPFVNGLYGTALGSRKMYQAGVRSAQGVAAMTCGVGTLPYNLSIIRDLDAFPLRCAPDLLKEAGFHGTFFYGSDPTYDEMARFLAAHGVTGVVSQDELPGNLPKGAWSGLTDFVVFDDAARRVAKGLADGPQFALVMSLSNHSPYTPPEDLPPSVLARMELALKTSPNRASMDDRRRLLTHSYTDAAIERFFGQLELLGIAERSIVVLMADHSTGEDYVWGPDSIQHETDAAKAQVPFLVVIPAAFLARVKDRAALESALAAAQQQLNATPLSQNDVPALLLALLKFHPGLRALPPASRWHTLGGQVTSPWFKPGGAPESFLLGINGVDELYVLDQHGNRVGAYEDAVFLRTRSERAQVTPRLMPVAATLVETLRSPKRCP